jgi:hypothetical protein
VDVHRGIDAYSMFMVGMAPTITYARVNGMQTQVGFYSDAKTVKKFIRRREGIKDAYQRW